jgi:hypothetical protein
MTQGDAEVFKILVSQFLEDSGHDVVLEERLSVALHAQPLEPRLDVQRLDPCFGTDGYRFLSQFLADIRGASIGRYSISGCQETLPIVVRPE